MEYRYNSYRIYQATVQQGFFGTLTAPFFYWYLLYVIVRDMCTELTKEKCMYQL